MSSPSVPDSVTYATSKGQSLTEQRSITDDKCASDVNPSDQDGGSGKPRKRKRRRGSQKRMEEKRKAEELFSSRRKEEEEENIEPPFTMTTRLESRFPIRDYYHLHRTDQTWPSQYRGRVHGGRHIPSHSSEPVISNAPSPPVTSGATSVVQPSPSVSGQTPLSKPALVSPAPLQTPHKTFPENCKVDYRRPRMLEQHKNDKKHQKNKRVCEELVQRRNTINGKQSGQIHISQLNLTDHPKKVQKSEKNGCPTQNIASEFMVDNRKREIQLQINVGNISEVPAEAPEGKTMEKEGGKYMGTNDGSKQPANTVSVRYDLCDVKSESQFVHQSHVTGKNHLSKRRHTRYNRTINAQVRQGYNNPQLRFKCDVCNVKYVTEFAYQRHMNGRSHLRKLNVARDDHILCGEDKQAVSGKPLGLQRLCPPDINAQLIANSAQFQQGDNNRRVLSKPVKLSKQVKVLPFTCDVCRVKHRSRAAYQWHMNGLFHVRRLNLVSEVARFKKTVSDAINDQVQRGDGNSLLFAELLTTVLSKTLVPAGAPVTCASAANIPAPAHTSVAGPSYQPRLLQNQVSEIKARAKIPALESKAGPSYQPRLTKNQAHAKIPAPTSMAGPSYKPQLLQTQVSEIQAHVEIEDPSGKTKTELAVDAEIPAARTSMAGPSYEAQLLQTQVSEITAHVEMENPSGETKTELVVAAEISAPTFMAGPSCEPQLLQTQGSEVKTLVEMENPSGETKAELAMAAEIPAPTSIYV